MPTGFRILCTHEGAAAVKDPSCLEQCARSRERSVFVKRRVCGLSYRVRSYLAGIQDVVFRRRPTLFISTDDLSRSARLLETEMLSTIAETRFRKTASFARPPSNFRTVW
ncbi:hypothetical protein TNIN_9031 [Trichonephila inaurata madagascariensis]|uniref:Uncharacterized protein n=1 Tax=Trichonephila inaurata madagascariensis TaxID=2747483 RepID=A0A8X6YNS5_9ARAC|nr:hypothetical protein TNIN_9031 [Trichonephila inaurata madagascariensis]